jgi:adenylate cyclase
LVFVFFLGILFVFSGLFGRLDNWLTDTWFNLRIERNQNKSSASSDSFLFPNDQEGNEIVLVIIDDTSILSIPGLFKGDRSVFARALMNLKPAGAKVIGLDVFFPSPEMENPEPDLELVDAVKELGNVVVKAYRRDNRRMTPPFPLLARNTVYAPTFFSASGDDSIRKVSLFFESESDQLTPSFQLEILKKYWDLPADAIEIDEKKVAIKGQNKTWAYPLTDHEFLQINYDRSLYSFKTLSFADVYQNIVDLNLFRDKIVIIGFGNSMTEEKYYTPIADKVYSPFLHGLALMNLIGQKGLKVVPAHNSFLIAILVLIFIHFVLFPILSAPWVIGLSISAIISGLMVSLSLLTVYRVQMGFSAVFFVIIASMVYSIVNRYYREFSEKLRIKHAFQHYVTASVVNEILKNPEKLNLHGEEKNLTIFFSDIEGFTSLSEGMSPLDVVSLLNEYLSEMTEIIFKFEGLLDKYEGDAIMAVFGAPVNQKDHAIRACRCALENQKALAKLREKWKKEGKPELRARIGINTGIVVVGNMGSRMRFDYTVIGDNVNLAARLETANKIMDTEILVSEGTALLAQEEIVCRCLGKLKVAGKTTQVNVYEVLADRISSDSKELAKAQALKKAYDTAYNEFSNQNFSIAEGILSLHLKDFPDDQPAKNLLAKTKGFLIVPPPPNWEDIITQDAK